MSQKLTERITAQMQESTQVKLRTLETCIDNIARAAEVILKVYREGHMIFLCGNGGSASDAQHIAGELVSKLTRERAALPAMALTTNTSLLTAIANDYDYTQVFARQVEAHARPGDALIAISTSGRSASVNAAVRTARQRGIHTIALTGKNGGDLAGLAEVSIIVPSDNTQRIQETHITIGHIWCDWVEESLFG